MTSSAWSTVIVYGWLTGRKAYLYFSALSVQAYFRYRRRLRCVKPPMVRCIRNLCARVGWNCRCPFGHISRNRFHMYTVKNIGGIPGHHLDGTFFGSSAFHRGSRCGIDQDGGALCRKGIDGICLKMVEMAVGDKQDIRFRSLENLHTDSQGRNTRTSRLSL